MIRNRQYKNLCAITWKILGLEWKTGEKKERVGIEIVQDVSHSLLFGYLSKNNREVGSETVDILTTSDFIGILNPGTIDFMVSSE
ncbi:hypothetical protein TSUD_94390 [Trifolium subterraneum]|uniref:Uncharacterized protein n=1 Tax=Trifolium subterraneum TaxID=3900 RepID=A0A2Z6NTG2_TRISU|nr:hypothetical protein TSUD_94390 [Trifolium subterraneum]